MHIAQSVQLPLTHRYALLAFEALRDGPIITIIHEGRHGVTEALDWTRTPRAHERWVPGTAHEARRLIGLSAAAGLGLVTLHLATLPGDSAAYSARWELRGAAK